MIAVQMVNLDTPHAQEIDCTGSMRDDRIKYVNRIAYLENVAILRNNCVTRYSLKFFHRKYTGDKLQVMLSMLAHTEQNL